MYQEVGKTGEKWDERVESGMMGKWEGD